MGGLEYTIFADESDKDGKFFGNFYGAALVRSAHIDYVEHALREAKLNSNLTREIKWTKMPSKDDLFEAYRSVMDLFLDFVKRDMIKIRIMFTQNIHIPVNLTKEQRDNEYYMLYYQFMKHAFGFEHNDEEPGERHEVRFYFDDLPETDPEGFKSFIYMLDTTSLWGARYSIRRDNIAEVKSHDHCILQCMDIVLGAMCFRLNDKHLEKPLGQRRRAKKTIYKEKMYRHIYGHIKDLHPHFNPGMSTGLNDTIENRWRHSYRHWLFVSKEHRTDLTLSKKHKLNTKGPITPRL